jgi:hypothetical protein
MKKEERGEVAACGCMGQNYLHPIKPELENLAKPIRDREEENFMSVCGRIDVQLVTFNTVSVIFGDTCL